MSFLRLPQQSKSARAAVEAGTATKEAVDLWRVLLDPEQTTERQFAECFTIITDLVTDDGEAFREPVPFLLREVQAEELAIIERFRAEKRPAKIEIPKSRGHGVTSFNVFLFGCCRLLRIPGYTGCVTAQSQKWSNKHRGKLQEFYDQVDWVALAELGITIEKSTEDMIVILHTRGGKKRRSSIEFLTATADGLGRGTGYDFIINTERPWYPVRAQEDATGLLTRMSQSRWSAHIDESSPNGLGEFFKSCQAAKKGKGGYRLLFLPAYMRPNNYFRPDQFDKAKLLADLGTNTYYGGAEETEKREMAAEYWRGENKDHKPQTVLAPEEADEKALCFLAWRREEIDGNCRGSLSFFRREHGCTMEEAFQGTGRAVFDLTILRTWSDKALARTQEAAQFDLGTHDKDVRALRQYGGPWLVLETPKEGGEYAFGADTASGTSVQADGGRESDFSHVTMIDVFTGKTVAVLRAHMDHSELALQIVMAARWYRNAEGLVESNNHGAAVIACMKALEVDWGNGSDCLLETTKMVDTSTGQVPRKQLGRYTSKESKGEMVRVMQDFIRETGSGKRPSAPESPFDYGTLQELTLYIYNDRGQMGPERGHDDAVIALGEALIARAMRIENGDIALRSPAKPERAMSDARRALREQDKREPPELAPSGALPGY